MSKLTDIRGVGEKVAEKLVAHYGSEQEAVRSLQNLEFERLFCVADIPALKLVDIARDVYAQKHGFEYINLLKTQEAREIYPQILDALREHAQTEYARLRLALFYPTNDRHELERRFLYVQKARDFYEALDAESFKNLKSILRNLKPVEKPKKTRIPGEVIVTESKKLYEELRKYSELIEIFLLESPEDLEYLKDYELVRYVHTRDSGYAAQVEALPQTETLPDYKPENCVPEEILSFFIENKKQISAACEILKILSKNPAFKNLRLEALDEKAFSEIAGKLQIEKSKFSFAAANLHAIVRECVEAANASIVEKAEKESLSLHGREVLKILADLGSRPSEIYEHLPQEIITMLRSAAEGWEEECARRLGIEDERIMLSGIFSEELRYPLQTSQEKLQEVETWLRSEAKKAEFKMKRELAASLKDMAENIRKSITSLLELDVLLALGEFSAEYEASLPRLTDTLGLGFKGAKHLLLHKKKLNPQPVDYVLGSSEMKFAGAGSERIAVITGANSGGKTTLIETIAQLQIMAQCGLPVLAKEASLALLDELYYYGRNRDDTSAGAFENLLKSFAGLSTSGAKRLILADEIEAVTEPGAAAKIISALLEWFEKDENALVALVTHLGEDIDAKVRIDGIEAEGLDENLNLIVNRNPVLNKLAKSTPELIVQKLSRTEKAHADFYRHVLKKFKLGNF
ncbi:MAG: hypothetical protein QME59_00365 [Candidatus Hydrothermarchaeota archaeon]|nr:hypothetical protein [Candidatus Hydrothermarchaeota archaeon]